MKIIITLIFSLSIFICAYGERVNFRSQMENVIGEPGAFAGDLTFDLSEFEGKSTAYANLIVPIEIGGEGYPSLNLWHVAADGSRELATTLTPGGHPAIHLALTDFLNPRLPLGKITFHLEQIAGSEGTISIPATRPIMLTLSTDPQPRITLEEMLAPIWKSPRVHDESILPVSREGEPATAMLLFQPAGPVLVRNRALDQTFSEGVDYTVDGKTIRLTPDSAIPSMTIEQLYPQSGGPGIAEGTGGTFVLTRGILEQQLSVSYDRRSEWDGTVPASAGDKLPLIRGKLERGEPVTIALLGDSISFGASASRASPPFVPGWGELFIRGLRQRYDADITFVNRSRGGANSNWGQKVAPAFIVPEKPDLCILAFGMNDANGTPTEAFLRNITTIMEQVRGGNPAVEFILVAPMLRNEKWRPLQPMDTYLDGLTTLASESVAVADVWSISRHIARTKGPYETSDHINHPNDFIVRVYAQVALALLGE
jgi:lysophospholipase L1-like esterase